MSPFQEVLSLWPEIFHGHVASREAQAGVRLETRQKAQLYSHVSGVYRVSLYLKMSIFLRRWVARTVKPPSRSGQLRPNRILFANIRIIKRGRANRRGQVYNLIPIILSVYNCKVELSREIKQISREIKNLGGNQLHCYPCDYSSCLGCVSLSLSSQGSEAARIMATLNDNKPSHRKHSHRTKRVRNFSW